MCGSSAPALFHILWHGVLQKKWGRKNRPVSLFKECSCIDLLVTTEACRCRIDLVGKFYA